MDVQLFIKSMTFADAIIEINNDLDQVQNWATVNGLRINHPRSKCVICLKRSLNRDILINGGIILNNHNNLRFAFNSHKPNCLTLCYFQHFTPQHVRLLLAKSYIKPSILYGCKIYSNCYSVCKGKNYSISP